jgi:hypothetical protein
MQVLAEMQQTG